MRRRCPLTLSRALKAVLGRQGASSVFDLGWGGEAWTEGAPTHAKGPGARTWHRAPRGRTGLAGAGKQPLGFARALLRHAVFVAQLAPAPIEARIRLDVALVSQTGHRAVDRPLVKPCSVCKLTLAAPQSVLLPRSGCQKDQQPLVCKGMPPIHAIGNGSRRSPLERNVRCTGIMLRTGSWFRGTNRGNQGSRCRPPPIGLRPMRPLGNSGLNRAQRSALSTYDAFHG